MIKNAVFITLLFALALFSCTQQQSSNKSEKDQSAVHSGQPAQEKQKTIIFFGNSLTAAFGLNVSQGFAGRIEKRLDSLHSGFKVVHAGNSGETTAGGVSRVDWVISQGKTDIFVLELGGNDALRGLKVSETEKNLQMIIDKVHQKNPDCTIVLAGMYAPTNMGKTYTSEFQAIYPRLARKNKIPLIPFLLEGVGGVPKLNQADGIHPTPEGHLIVTENVWKVLKDYI